MLKSLEKQLFRKNFVYFHTRVDDTKVTDTEFLNKASKSLGLKDALMLVVAIKVPL